MKTLNVIGAGRVGRTLASLWAQRSTFALQDVLDGTAAGAQAAVVFIGAGNAVDKLETMRAAEEFVRWNSPSPAMGSVMFERPADARLVSNPLREVSR